MRQGVLRIGMIGNLEPTGNTIDRARKESPPGRVAKTLYTTCRPRNRLSGGVKRNAQIESELPC